MRYASVMASQQFIQWTKPALNAIHIAHFYGSETLRGHYQYTLTIVTSTRYDQLILLIGQRIQWRLQTTTNQRYFSGVCIQVESLDMHRLRHQYRLIIAAGINLLVHHIDNRIYTNTTLTSLIYQLCHGHIESQLSFAYSTNPSIHYQVQFNQSHYTYIRLLMDTFDWFYWVRHEKVKSTIMISDRSNLITRNPSRSLTISNYRRADYQLWHWNGQSAYSNYPDLHIAERINGNHIITSIKHTAVDDGSQQYYHQFLTFNTQNEIPKLKIKKAKIAGIDRSIRSSKNSVIPLWETNKLSTHTLEHSLNQGHIKIDLPADNNQQTLICYKHNNIDQPYIAGYLYDAINHAAIRTDSKTMCAGWYDNHQNQFKLAKDEVSIRAQQQLQWHVQSNLSLSAQNACHVNSDHKMSLNAHNKISINSNNSITIGNNASFIKITPDQIEIRHRKIELTT